MCRVAVGGELLLEADDGRSEHELGAVEHARHGSVNLRLERTVLRLQICERNHQTTAPVSEVRRPCCAIDAVAVSSSLTTRNPASPSVVGRTPRVMQSRKCAASAASASLTASFGAHISPVRYPTSIW